MTKLEILKADITEMECDAIVNAANTALMGGGGVDGAIHAKAGPLLLKECAKIGGCPTGEARITPAFNLKSKYIIHAVGPIWRDGRNNERKHLENAYKNSIKLASANKIKSIAFPNISTGIYRFPKREAARIAFKTVEKAAKKNGISEVYFVCFDEENYAIYKEMAASKV